MRWTVDSIEVIVYCDVDFHDALNAMQSTMVEDSRGRAISEYHLITSLHQFRLAPAAHNGPAFLTWHREYCHRFTVTYRGGSSMFEWRGHKSSARSRWVWRLGRSIPSPMGEGTGVGQYPFRENLTFLIHNSAFCVLSYT